MTARKFVLASDRPDDRKKFGRTIRQLRSETSNVSTAWLAERLNVTPAYVRMIERGERTPSFDVTRELLLNLGADVAEQLSEADGRLALVAKFPSGETLTVKVKTHSVASPVRSAMAAVATVAAVAAVARLSEALEERLKSLESHLSKVEEDLAEEGLVNPEGWPETVTRSAVRQPNGETDEEALTALMRDLARLSPDQLLPIRTSASFLLWDLEFAEAKAEVEPRPDALNPPATADNFPDPRRVLARDAPAAAVLQTFAELEAQLRQLLEQAGIDAHGAARQTARLALDARLIQPETMSAICGVAELRDRAAHGLRAQLDERRALDYLALVDAVSYALSTPARLNDQPR